MRPSIMFGTMLVSDGVSKLSHISSAMSRGSITLLRAQGIDNFDLAVAKKVAIAEQVGFEFRSESFNLFNRVQFAPQLLRLMCRRPSVQSLAMSTSGQPAQAASAFRTHELLARHAV